MSDTLSKIRDKTAQQKPKYQDPLLSQLRAIAEGYWNRQGQIAREGSTLADIGRQQLQSGNPMGLVNLPLGAAAWLGSPAGALVPTSDEVYATDLPEWSKPGVAGVLMGMSAMTPGPDIPKAGRAAKAASAADEGITAYHGSPHTFDKFDMSKIGTGEGAQAYGHGLYFAESEKVAKSYRDALGSPVGSWKQPDNLGVLKLSDGVKVTPNDLVPYAMKLAKDLGIDEWWGKLAAERLQPLIWNNNQKGMDEVLRQFDSGGKMAMDARGDAAMKALLGKLDRGSMYQVRLNVKPDELLDWDRPLSEQPIAERTKEILKSAGIEAQVKQVGLDPMSMTGEGLHGWIRDPKQAAKATEQLQAAGIKGIRYKDAGSRDKDGGTYNYVIFDDKLIDILKRYAIPFTLGAGGAAMVSGGDMPPEIAAQMGPEA